MAVPVGVCVGDGYHAVDRIGPELARGECESGRQS